MKYNFYYDETEHSREINFDTITASNFYDSFVTAIVGWDEKKQFEIEKKYLAFEEKYSYRKSKGELKSTSIDNKKFKNGFASCNREYISFLTDFLCLFTDDIRLYFASISKMEYLTNQLFTDYHNTVLVDIDSFKYTIVKALVTNRPVEIENAIYNNPEQFASTVKAFLKKKIEIDKQNAELKKREIKAFSDVLLVLDDVKPPKQFSWDYRTSFIGFKKYIDENSIVDYTLTIDKEGNEQKTLHAAQECGIKNVSEASSSNVWGIRMADMLAGLIAKMMKALCQSLLPTNPDSISKTLLPKQWFNINEKQLQLYKQFYHVACELNNSWYKSFSSIYADDAISLVALLGFMNHFSSIDEIKNNLDMQGEYFNACVCQALDNYYSQIKNKLSVDPISRNELIEGYFYNQRGAKCYFDTEKQPILPFPQKENLYHVLSVGFDRNAVPLVTISQDGSSYCYRLPQELCEWVCNAVAWANIGGNCFPADVIFTKERGQISADIL